MFILTTIADLVQIKPEDFNLAAAITIEDAINRKYANKVVQKLGLCICFYDLISASDGLIGHGTGLVNVNVEFRMIVFRPFKHEVLTGKISSCNQDGIRVRTHFFDEFWIPKDALPEGAFFSHKDQLFVWKTGDDSLYYDSQEMVRFRVDKEIWQDQAPEGPAMFNQDPADAGPDDKKSPYIVIGAMDDSGLGPCLWWDGDGEGEEGE